MSLHDEPTFPYPKSARSYARDDDQFFMRTLGAKVARAKTKGLIDYVKFLEQRAAQIVANRLAGIWPYDEGK